MIRLLGAGLRWLGRHVVIFALVVLALWVAAKIFQAYQSLPALRQDVAMLESQKSALDDIVAARMAEARASAERIDDLERAALERRLAALRVQIARSRRAEGSRAGLALDLARGEGGAVARQLGEGLRLQLMEREEATITARLEMIAGEARLGNLSGHVTRLDAQAAALRRRISEIEQAHPILSRAEDVAILQGLDGPWRALSQTRQALREVEAGRQRAGEALAAQKRAQSALAERFVRSRAAMLDLVSPSALLQQAIDEKKAELSRHWGSRLWGAMAPLLGPALWIMLLVVAVPPAVKALWYFVVAPFAARLRPIIIAPDLAQDIGWARARPGEEEPPAAGSGVSRRVVLLPGDELIVRPEFLQSSMNQAEIDSVLVLSRAIPFGSLATGLIGLTRIRVRKREVATLSATEDLFDEIGLIDIPEGAGLIFKPRNLIGVIQRSDRPVRIRRVWRLGHLSAWLRLQLRFLVFQGPATLVVKGARGVALEPSRNGRRIAGAATLGWSAGLAYSVQRSETFLAYLMGKQSLFNDGFEGARGIVVYEEVPRRGARGLHGRGLEGLGDGLLKVIGL